MSASQNEVVPINIRLSEQGKTHIEEIVLKMQRNIKKQIWEVREFYDGVKREPVKAVLYCTYK